MKKGFVLAVDGPAASGKGTLAQKLAHHFNLPYLDTGLLYRAIGQKMQAAGIKDENAAQQEEKALFWASCFEASWLSDPRLRDRMAGEAASKIAKFTSVRAALRQFQRDFAYQEGGAVLDGRDIGTVIAPEARFKFWIDAALPIRAKRRYLELIKRGEQVEEADILADLAARDARDAPNMLIAPDAARILTDALNPDEVLKKALAVIEAITAQKPQ